MLLAQYYNSTCQEDKVKIISLHCNRCGELLKDVSQTVELGGRFGCKNCLEILKKLKQEDLNKLKQK